MIIYQLRVIQTADNLLSHEKEQDFVLFKCLTDKRGSDSRIIDSTKLKEKSG